MPTRGRDPLADSRAALGVSGVDSQPTISAKGKKVLDRFNSRIEDDMRMKVRDLVNPNIERVEGQPFLKKMSPDKMKGHLKDLFLDMPLGDSAMGRELAEVLGKTPAGRGKDLSTMSPNELKDELGDQAKDWIKTKIDKTREEHPALFWSTATAALVGAGALTYAKGTEILEKAGVKPELKKNFFDGKLRTKTGVEFGPKLSDPRIRLDASTRFAGGKIEVGGGTTLAGEDFGSLKPSEFHLNGTLRHGNTTLNGSVDLDGGGSIDRFGVNGSHTWTDVGSLDKLTLAGGYDRNLVTGSEEITGGLRGVARTYDFNVRGSHELSNGSSSVMADVGMDVGGGRLSAFADHSWGGPRGSDTKAGVMFTIRF